MADNSVTIALKLDTTNFNAGLAQAQGALRGLGVSGGRGGGGSKASGSQSSANEAKVISYLTSMTKGTTNSFTMLGAVKGLMGASVTALAGIAAGVAIMVVAISALQLAIKPINSILNAIGKVLGAALMPISMIIVTLLKPFIFMMMPFIRLMNIIFRPLRQYLAQRLSALVAEKGGAISGTDYMNAVLGGFQDWIAAGLIEFSKMFLVGVLRFIVGVDKTLAMLPEINAVFDSLKKGFKLDITMGEGTKIITPGTPEAGKGTGGTPIKTEPVVPVVDPFEEFKKGLVTMKTTIDNFDWMRLVNDADSKLFGDENSVKSAAVKAWNQMLIDANTYLPAITDSFKSFVNIMIRIANGIITAINTIGTIKVFGIKLLETNFPSIAEVNDFVLQPGGRLIKTNPNDTIYGTTNPGGMGGGTVNITINVEGNVDDKTAKYITQTIQREIATQWRSIAR